MIGILEKWSLMRGGRLREVFAKGGSTVLEFTGFPGIDQIARQQLKELQSNLPLSNLVPRVPRLFGQRVGARRDSGEFEKL